MTEMRDTAIKLFGKTIPLRPSGEKPPPVSGDGRRSTGEDEKDLENKEATTPESKDRKHESTDAQENNDPPVSDEISKPPWSNKEEDPSTIDSKSKELEDGKNQPKEKGLKKPDKILPCPRCNSMDTKFCYYNNYNLNQPRHFCKKCQRYWTAGGTMRNVPVGSGRRKNKNSASHYRHIVVSDSGLQAIHAEVPDPVSCPPRPNGASVLSFGFDNSMNSCNQKRFQKREEKLAPPSCSAENVGEQSSESSVTTPNSQVVTSVNEQATQISTPCCKGSPWPYPCIPAPFVAPSFPIPFFPVAPYWSCAVPPPEAWSIPWVSPIASSNNCCQGAGNNSSTLGKHSRDGTLLNNGTVVKEGSHKQSNQERCIWFPKTLRIDDPKEAAMSSIWATIGVKNDKADAISGGGLFKAFQPKVAIMNHTMEASQLLHANPAAVSRSINFHESS